MKLAKDAGVTLDKLERTISLFYSKIDLPGVKNVQPPVIPLMIENYIGMSSEVIQLEKTIADTWQAASRAKDPEGKIPSVIYCLGLSVDEVLDIKMWGANMHFRKFNKLHRLSSEQETMISAPHSITISDNFDDIQTWLDGGTIKPEIIGFGKDLYAGIIEMLIYTEYVTSKEVWLNYNHNLPVGKGTPDHGNGYFIGTIRALMQSGIMEDIIVEEKFPGEFVFRTSPTPQQSQQKRVNFNVDLVCNVLKLAYLHNGNRVSYIDIRRNIRDDKASDDEIKEAMAQIKTKRLLKNRTWTIENAKTSINLVFVKNVQKSLKFTIGNWKN